MKRSQAFPSKYISKDDVDPPKTLTIKTVRKDVLKGEDGDEEKTVIYFTEQDSKPFIVNVANWMTIEDMHGEESDDWTGKKIELYKDPSVMFGSKRVGGVRVRKPANGNTNPVPQRNGNEYSTADDKSRWLAFCKANGYKAQHILEALEMQSVVEWMKANSATLDGAMEKMTAHFNADETPF